MLSHTFHREGSYCATPGLPSVTGPCAPGYYCARGASRADPTDGITGDVCTPGRYCGKFLVADASRRSDPDAL